MKRIEYSDNLFKCAGIKLKEFFLKKPAVGILTGITAVMLVSLVIIFSLAKKSKSVIVKEDTTEVTTKITTESLSSTGSESAVSVTGSTQDSSSSDASRFQSSDLSSASALTTSVNNSSQSNKLIPATSEIQAEKSTPYGLCNSLYYQSSVLNKQNGCSFLFSEKDLTFYYNNGGCSVFPHDNDIVAIRKDKDQCFSCPYVAKNKTALACILNNELVIAYSNDKGKVWNYSSPIGETPIYAVTGYVSGIDFNDYLLSYTSNNTGYLVLILFSTNRSAYSGLFKTTDGGRTWNYICETTSIANFDFISGLYFTNDNTGYICTTSINGGPCHLCYTSDGGKTWHEVLEINRNKYGNKNGYVTFSPYFIDNKGYFPVESRDDYKINYFISNDSGKTWIYDLA